MIALIIITLLFIVALILTKTLNDDFFEPICVLFVLFFLFGWFGYGLLSASKEEIIYLSPSDLTITKGDGVVVYVYKNKMIKSTNYHIVNNPEKFISKLYLCRKQNVFSMKVGEDILKMNTDE